MRPIDADVLLEPIEDCEERETCDGCPLRIRDCEDFEKVIKAAPTIDAVYICNRRKCDQCNPECDFTRDINYAAATDKVIIVDGAAYAVKGKGGAE